MTNRIWILGAPDPEMEAIESLLRECGERVAYALDDSGERVRAGGAYRVAKLSEPIPEDARVYAVECAGAAIPAGAIVIDHHRPGDPGYGQPPAEFLSASSIGQVIAELAHTRTTSNLFNYDVVLDNARQWSRIEAGTHHDETMGWGCDDDRIPDVKVERYSDLGDPLPTVVRLLEQPWPMPFAWVAEIGAYIISTPRGGFELGGLESWHVVPHDFVLVAAADHCLAAAYRGECPGVDPDALMRWRVESRARFQGRSVEEILADIARAREALRRAPEVDLAMCCDGAYVRDLRDCHVPELPDAASRDGEAYLALVNVDGSGRPCRPKIVLGGATTPEMVRAFIEHWAPAHGLVDCYGDPERGFAGGYLAESSTDEVQS